MENERIRVGITQGDPNGVGLEIIQKAFADESLLKHFIPVLFASPKSYIYTKKQLASHGIEAPSFHQITTPEEAKAGRLNLIPTGSADFAVDFGKPSAAAGAEALASLSACVEAAVNGKLGMILTSPLDKATVAENLPGFDGHTGFIARELGAENYAMMLIADELRIALVTEHVPVQDVSKVLTREKIAARIRTVHQSLQRDFRITRPRIALLGLNPHAGDSGLLGSEEIERIKPETEAARKDGMLVYGPYSADSFFGSGQAAQFDAILAMYHDQGLIPFKSAAFYEGVNYTAGLPVVRTSPDHGTAYALAGKGEASALSFMNALFDGLGIVGSRAEHDYGKASFLPFAEMKRERFRIDF